MKEAVKKLTVMNLAFSKTSRCKTIHCKLAFMVYFYIWWEWFPYSSTHALYFYKLYHIVNILEMDPTHSEQIKQFIVDELMDDSEKNVYVTRGMGKEKKRWII